MYSPCSRPGVTRNRKWRQTIRVCVSFFLLNSFQIASWWRVAHSNNFLLILQVWKFIRMFVTISRKNYRTDLNEIWYRDSLDSGITHRPSITDKSSSKSYYGLCLLLHPHDEMCFSVSTDTTGRVWSWLRYRLFFILVIRSCGPFTNSMLVKLWGKLVLLQTNVNLFFFGLSKIVE